MKAVIFDLDGTTFNCDHRLHHLSDPTLDRNQQWNAFFAGIPGDTPIEPMVWLARVIEHLDDVEALYVTARPEDYRSSTEQQLTDAGLWSELLYMRKTNDVRPDHVVKAEILERILENGYEPILAFDDKENITQMWRSFGIVAAQVAPNEPNDRYAGQALLTILVGPSGAGKSTHISYNYRDRDVVSPDQIRADYGWGHSPDDLKRTWALARSLVRARIDNGLPAVLDATSIKTKDRISAAKLAPDNQIVNYVVIDRDLDDKLRDRGWRSEDLVLKHHRTMQANIKSILAGDNLPNVVVYDRRERK